MVELSWFGNVGPSLRMLDANSASYFTTFVGFGTSKHLLGRQTLRNIIHHKLDVPILGCWIRDGGAA
jgi:hypothetical protein